MSYTGFAVETLDVCVDGAKVKVKLVAFAKTKELAPKEAHHQKNDRYFRWFVV